MFACPPLACGYRHASDLLHWQRMGLNLTCPALVFAPQVSKTNNNINDDGGGDGDGDKDEDKNDDGDIIYLYIILLLLQTV